MHFVYVMAIKNTVISCILCTSWRYKNTVNGIADSCGISVKGNLTFWYPRHWAPPFETGWRCCHRRQTRTIRVVTQTLGTVNTYTLNLNDKNNRSGQQIWSPHRKLHDHLSHQYLALPWAFYTHSISGDRHLYAQRSTPLSILPHLLLSFSSLPPPPAPISRFLPESLLVALVKNCRSVQQSERSPSPITLSRHGQDLAG